MIFPSSIIPYKIFVALFALLFLPSFLYVGTSASSMALGVFIACLLIVLLFLDRKLKFRLFEFNYANSIIFSLFLYQFLIFIFGQYRLTEKTFVSAFLIIGVILSSLFFASALKNIDHFQFIKVLTFMSVISLFTGFFSLVFDITLLNYDRFTKSVFPYAEPSHYAISVGPVLFSTGFLLNERARIIITASFYCLALLFPSVILLAFALLMTCFYFFKNYFNVLVFFVVVFILLTFLQLSELGLYFTDRLIISDNSSNITLLTYLQGWSDMVISLEYSYYLGVGFQNMGMLAPSVYGETIYALTGIYKNREDGGFLAAKIVSEFGFLGVIFILFYLKYFFRSIKLLWHHVRRVDFKQNSVLVFSNGVIVAFAVELFARGYGYFSPGFILFITSVMIAATTKRLPTLARRRYK